MKPLFADATPAHKTPSVSNPAVEGGPVAVTLAGQAVVAVQARPTSPLAPSLNVPTPKVTVSETDLTALGDKSTRRVAAISEQLLGMVRGSGSDQFGVALTQLLSTAQQLDPKLLFDKSLIGKLKGLFVSAKEQVKSQFRSVSGQLDALVGELERSARTYEQRIRELEDMYLANGDEYNALGEAVRKGQELLAALNDEIAHTPAATDPMAAQAIGDRRQLAVRLEKRIDDLKRAQMIAMQTAPEIRLLQNNSRMLIAKFQDIVAVTIPAWKKQFSLHILMEEQAKSAELVTAIDDATNAALRKNADLLRQNTTAITRANQRALVEMETLEHVQKQLLGAFEDMQKINDEAAAARAQTDAKLASLRDELIDRFQKNA
ncbi:toxic anion resistance protein [Accumulibacter sp.]|uniref:toxic anion resistance protein n=1 Tax=Accumulibacter sp. TaxID=2053492 RepID=UPI002B8B032B|nr:toxic anion resistance protein [Accumulibacter sp.]HPU80580.1 toxic anion resistance protein [Accumulibacter sp.]